jgi:hypothetical protein
LFSLVGNDVSNISIPIYIIDTSLSPSYNLSSSVTSVNTDNSSFIVSLITTGVTNGSKIPYIITGVDTTDISYVNLSGSFLINNSSSFLLFCASKNKITNGNKIFTLSLVDYSISTNVTFIDTNPLPLFQIKTSLTTSYFTYSATVGIRSFSFYLWTNTSVPNNTPTKYILSGITSSDISNDLSGILLSTQNENINVFKTITITSFINPFTLKISSTQSNINPIQIGINYDNTNKKMTVISASDTIRDINSTFLCQLNSTIKIKVTLFAYSSNMTYTLGTQTGTIYYDVSGFQKTTTISYLFIGDVSLNIGSYYQNLFTDS